MGNEAVYDALDNSFDRVGPPLESPPADICEYRRTWLDRDGFPHWSLWENVRTWWEIRNLRYRTFEWMKEHGEKIVPMSGAMWIGGTKTFNNKSANGRWRETQTAAESAEYGPKRRPSQVRNMLAGSQPAKA